MNEHPPPKPNKKPPMVLHPPGRPPDKQDRFNHQDDFQPKAENKLGLSFINHTHVPPKDQADVKISDSETTKREPAYYAPTESPCQTRTPSLNFCSQIPADSAITTFPLPQSDFTALLDLAARHRAWRLWWHIYCQQYGLPWPPSGRDVQRARLPQPSNSRRNHDG